MSRKQVSQPLASLLPTLTGGPESIPTQLTDLAVMLLAQSRYKAPNLRPEEEVARAYACAHLACERLKGSLDLPKIQPRPPCAPKVYERVCSYFKTVLNPASSAATTPITATHPSFFGTPTSSHATPSGAGKGNGTPNPPVHRGPGRPRKNPVPGPGTPAASGTPARFGAGTSSAARQTKPGLSIETRSWDPTLPEWVMRGIFRICGSFGVRPAGPHVLAGVQSLRNASLEVHALPQPGSRRPGAQAARLGPESERVMQDMPEVTEAVLPGLMVAVFLLAFPRLTGKTCDDGMERWIGQAIEALREVNEKEGLGIPLGQEADQWALVLGERAREYLNAAQIGGWVEMEWYRNMEPGSIPVRHHQGNETVGKEDRNGTDEDGDVDMDGGDDHEDEDGEYGEGLASRRSERDEMWKAQMESGVSSRLGVHPAVLWFSKSRHDEYKAWEKEMLNRIAVAEQASGAAATT